MNRLLREVEQPFSKNDKLKMRMLFKEGLGLSKNSSEKKLADTIGVPLNFLYNYLAIDYNEYIRNENNRIINVRKEKAEQKNNEIKFIKSLSLNEIETHVSYPKNKFHITDHTFQYDQKITSFLEDVKMNNEALYNLTEEATQKMYLKLISYTSSNTYFRIWLTGENAQTSTKILSYGEYSYEQFEKDIEKLQQSETSNSIFKIKFLIQLRKIPNGGSLLEDKDIPVFLKKRGITLIYNNDDKCGQRCLVYADEKNLNNFKKDIKKKGRENYFDNKLEKLCKELDLFQKMNFVDFEKYADLRKKQIIIIGWDFNVLYETEKDYMDKSYLYYDGKIEHYHFIHDINSATNDISRNSKWCKACNKSYRVDTDAYNKHKCVELSCYFCKTQFETLELKDKHFKDAYIHKTWVNCSICNCCCPNNTCRSIHENKCKGLRLKCNDCKKYIDKDHFDKHICGEEYCSVCDIYHTNKDHRCFIQPLKKPEHPEHLIDYDNAEKLSIGSTYAYDFESMFDKDNRHIVNYAVTQKLFSDEQFVCNSLEEFCKFVLSKKNSTFIAHNGKAYDTWLIHHYLVRETNKRPTKLIMAGNKIMYMKIGSIRFIDSLNHIAQSLSMFPSIFGIKEMKKGYFPYLFNVKENQNYIGKIPEIQYFSPDEMKPETRKDFIKWYNQQNDYVYDFQKELREYCISDVNILKRSMEIYIEEGITLNGLNPIACSTIASYAMKVYRTNYLKPNTIAVLKKDEYDFCKRGFFGGRTEVFQLHKKFNKYEVANGKYISYDDIQSLYPTVQYYDQLPCGIPKWDENVSFSKEYLENHFGYYEVDVVCPDKLHIPLLPEKKDMKLNFDLVEKNKAVYTSIELLRAIEIGYKITKIYKVLYFEKTDTLFKEYVQNFLKIKTECAGYDGNDIDEYIERYYNACGVKLEKEKIKKNKGKKLLAKILLNSLWGKFGQKDDMATTEYITDPSKWFRKLRDNNEGKITLKNETLIDENTLYIEYISNETSKSSLNTTNVGLAGFVTSQARLRLYKELYKLGERVIYCDTDSIVYEHDDNKYNIPTSDVLGGWEAETKSPIIEFIGFAPKSYAYRCADGKVCEKCKGVTLNYNNKKNVNFDSLRDLVYGNKNILETQKMEFVKNSKEGTITTKYNVKEINFDKTKFKRIINDNLTTEPKQ